MTKKRVKTTQAQRDKNREALKLLFPEIYEKANQKKEGETGRETGKGNDKA